TSSSTTARTNAYLRQLSGKQIRLTIGDQSFTVDLYDNPTANDLYEQHPLTLTVNDYAGWDEKVIRLDKKLS
ncbi:cyclophilin-like fold protein, partial [Streptococcus suis]